MGPQDKGRAGTRNRDLVSLAAFQSDMMPPTPTAPRQTSLQLGYADEHELGQAHSAEFRGRLVSIPHLTPKVLPSHFCFSMQGAAWAESLGSGGGPGAAMKIGLQMWLGASGM